MKCDGNNRMCLHALAVYSAVPVLIVFLANINAAECECVAGAALSALSGLTSLGVRHCQTRYTAAGCAAIAQLTSLCELDLSGRICMYYTGYPYKPVTTDHISLLSTLTGMTRLSVAGGRQVSCSCACAYSVVSCQIMRQLLPEVQGVTAGCCAGTWNALIRNCPAAFRTTNLQISGHKMFFPQLELSSLRTASAGWHRLRHLNISSCLQLDDRGYPRNPCETPLATMLTENLPQLQHLIAPSTADRRSFCK